MNNVITFRPRGKPAPRNPSFELPTEDVVESTPRDRRQRILESPEPETETGKNARLRMARREAWWRAGRQVEYWKARMTMHHAICSVQRAGVPEANNHPTIKIGEFHYETWNPLVENYRKAIVRQFLTPAHRLQDVTWKQKALAAGEHKHTDLSSERIKTAIAEDLAFFAAHPIRRNTRGPAS